MEVAYLATKYKQPSKKDNDDLWNVLQYIKGRKDVGMKFTKSDMKLRFFADSSHLLHEDGLGHTGVSATGGTIVVARSTKQNGQARSSSEAELVTTEECSKYVAFMCHLCRELGIPCFAEPILN